MNILVLGGTGFFGKHLVWELLHRGHEVTIATRGRTPDDFGDRVRRLIVDRTDARQMEQVFAHNIMTFSTTIWLTVRGMCAPCWRRCPAEGM